MIGDENWQYENMREKRNHRKSRQEFRAEEKAKAEMYSRLITHKGKDNKMTEKVIHFAAGVKITKKEGKYGSFYKVGINVNEFCDKNPMNERGWVNFTIFEGKESGKPYAQLDTYGSDNNNVVKIDSVNDDEIPF